MTDRIVTPEITVAIGIVAMMYVVTIVIATAYPIVWTGVRTIRTVIRNGSLNIPQARVKRDCSLLRSDWLSERS